MKYSESSDNERLRIFTMQISTFQFIWLYATNRILLHAILQSQSISMKLILGIYFIFFQCDHKLNCQFEAQYKLSELIQLYKKKRMSKKLLNFQICQSFSVSLVKMKVFFHFPRKLRNVIKAHHSISSSKKSKKAKMWVKSSYVPRWPKTQSKIKAVNCFCSTANKMLLSF